MVSAPGVHSISMSLGLNQGASYMMRHLQWTPVLCGISIDKRPKCQNKNKLADCLMIIPGCILYGSLSLDMCLGISPLWYINRQESIHCSSEVWKKEKEENWSTEEANSKTPSSLAAGMGVLATLFPDLGLAGKIFPRLPSMNCMLVSISIMKSPWALLFNFSIAVFRGIWTRHLTKCCPNYVHYWT